MSAKNLDRHNRWRSKTIAFRMSPQEADILDSNVRLSGHTKQDYLCARALQQQITVVGNPRVYKALRNELAAVLDELKRIEAGAAVHDDLLDRIDQINTTLYGMKGRKDGIYNRNDCSEYFCWRRYGTAFSKMYCKYYNRKLLQFQ